MNTVVVYGPKACGKTRYADQISKAFGCIGITDEWDGLNLKKGHLHLCLNVPPDISGATIYSFADAYRFAVEG